jgi:hypothetical protein
MANVPTEMEVKFTSTLSLSAFPFSFLTRIRSQKGNLWKRKKGNHNFPVFVADPGYRYFDTIFRPPRGGGEEGNKLKVEGK